MLAPGTIELWTLELDRFDADAALLARNEQERAAEFRFEIHRNRFLAARTALRILLAHYTGVGPARVELVYGFNGKPHLAGERPPHFNISHTHGLAVFAFCPKADVGVDLERVDRVTGTDGIAARCFSPEELECLRALSRDHSKAEAFCRMWVEHEARLKATGQGLGAPITPESASLTVIHTEPWPGTRCAVATPLPSSRLIIRRFAGGDLRSPEP